MPSDDKPLTPAGDSVPEAKSVTSPTKPRIWPLFVGMVIELVLVIGLQIGVVLALLFAQRESGKPIQELAASIPQEMLKPGIFTLIIFLSGFSMISCGLLFGWLSARKRRESLARRLGLLWPQLSATKWIGLLFGSVPVLLVSVGVIAWRANSIWPSACCHAFINSGWNVYQVGRFHWGIPEIPSVWLLVPGGLIIALAFVWSIKNLIVMTPVPEPIRSGQPHG